MRGEERQKKKEQKFVLTMASNACEYQTGWRTQTAWTLVSYRLNLMDQAFKKIKCIFYDHQITVVINGNL